MERVRANQILQEQLQQLRELSMSELIKDEPELVVKLSLAMVEIATLLNLY